MQLDFAAAAAEFVRALRGRRSQVALSRRLGFTTNVVYAWERQKRSPSAGQLLWTAQRTGHDVAAALRAFFRRPCPWLDTHEPWSDAGVADLIGELRGAIPISELARNTRISRFALSRWLSATTQPKAGQLFALVHHATNRAPDFVAAFTSAELPSLETERHRLDAARNIARTHPWSQLVLRHLELVQYRALAKHQPGWIAERIGITLPDEESTLLMLRTAGQATWTGTHWAPLALPALDLRQDARTARKQRAFWANVASSRAPQAPDALCAYNVCTLSAQGYLELKALQREYLMKARSLIGSSEPPERVVLLQLNLLPFD